MPGGHLAAKRTKRPASGERNERWARSAPSAKIERPGKAGRYEFTLEDLRVLQTSPNGLFDSLRGKAYRLPSQTVKEATLHRSEVASCSR